MPFRLQPSKIAGSGGMVPSSGPDLAPEATQTFEKGTVVTVTAGEIVEHALGATVVGIYGVSLVGVSSGVSDDPSGNIQVAKADRNTVFVAKAISGGQVQTDLSGVDVGDQYGLLQHTDDATYVDLADVTNVVLQVEKVDDDLDLVWFKFLESALQEP